MQSKLDIVFAITKSWPSDSACLHVNRIFLVYVHLIKMNTKSTKN